MGGQLLLNGVTAQGSGLRNLADTNDRLDIERRDGRDLEPWREGALWSSSRLMATGGQTTVGATVSYMLGLANQNRTGDWSLPVLQSTAGFGDISYLAYKTTQWMFNTNTAGATATAVTLGASTLYSSETRTFYVPETGERRFKSVRLRVFARNEQATTQINLAGMRVNFTLGGNTATFDQVVTFASTASRDPVWELAFDLTDHFNKFFGTGTSQTASLQCAVATSAVSAVNGQTFELDVTYAFNPAATNTRIKTIRIPIQSHASLLTTVQQEIGTDGTNPAASGQIPALDTFLPEASKTYRAIFLDLRGNDGGAAGNTFTPLISIDGGAEVACANINQPLACTQYWRHQLDLTGSITTNATHTFSMRADTVLTSKMAVVGGFLVVTYEYDHAATVIGGTAMYEAIVPLTQSDGSGGPVLGVPYDAVSDDGVGGSGNNQLSNYQTWFATLDIQEPGPIVLAQSGIMFNSCVSSTNAANFRRAGNQTPRSYTPVSSMGLAPEILRTDFGDGWENLIKRGVNRLPCGAWQVTTGRTFMVGSYAVINYRAGIRNDVDRGNHAVLYQGKALNPGSTANSQELQRDNWNCPIQLGTPYKLSGVMLDGANGSGGVTFNIVQEQLTGEFDGGMGLTFMRTTAPQAVNAIIPVNVGLTGLFNQTNFGGRKHDIHKRRRVIYMCTTSSNQEIAFWITYHQHAFTVAGTVTIDGTPAVAGKDVEIYAASTDDPTLPMEKLTTVQTLAGGVFSVGVPDNIRSYFASYTDVGAGKYGRSAPNLVPGVGSFDITIGNQNRAASPLGSMVVRSNV